MLLNYPGKAKYYFFYLIIILLPIIVITYTYLEKKDQYIQKYLEKENVAYEAILSFQLETTQTIYDGVVNQPEVLEILKMAQSQDSSIRDDMRNQLYNFLLPAYVRIKSRGVRQFQFIFPDCESFLRFHRPNMYGDNLKGFRYSVEKANTDLVTVNGFEEGRIYNGFRNVFPIIADGQHLGSVEISMSYKSFTDKMDHLFHSHHVFALKKKVVLKKVRKSEYDNYQASDFSKEYLYESIFHPDQLTRELLGTFKADQSLELQKGLPFAVGKKYDGKYYLISFLPIKNIEGDHVAYLITYEPDDTLHTYLISYWVMIVGGSILALIAYVFSLNYFRKARDLFVAQQDLSAGKEKYRLISEHTHNWEYWINPDGSYNYISPVCERISGYPPERFEENSSFLTDIVVETYKEFVKTHFEIESLTEANCLLDDFKILTRDGKEKWLEHSCHPVYDDSGHFMGRRGVNRDITARKKGEEVLKSAKAFAENLIETANTIIITLDRNGIITTFNKYAEELTGYHKSEVIGNNWFDQFIPQENIDTIPKLFLDVLKNTPDASKHENTIKLKSGRNRMISWSNNILRDASNDIIGILSIGIDITDKIHAENERAKLEAQLHQSQKLEAVGTMVGGISHELNNVLQSIFLYGGLVQDELPDDTALRTNMQHLLDDGERARDIVKQILTFSRNTKVDMQPQLLQEFIMEALVLEKAALPANITLSHDIDMDCGSVLCDKTQIHQIIINLCNNAEHAMQERGGTLSVSLQQIQASINDSAPTAAVIELKVSDTGHGVDSETLEQIFDPFFTTKEVGKGTGLGLSVIHGIIEMMRGQITVSSKVGKGTTFRALFPVADKVNDSATTPKSVAHLDDEKKTILLVDDEDSIRLVTQTILTRKGFTVTGAANGKLALDLFKANPDKFDLIVTDQSMPKLSGTDLAEEIRNAKSGIPIILSTGQLGIDDKKEYANIGITGFIQKPWTADELITKIHEINNK